jgi:hypothetical protein
LAIAVARSSAVAASPPLARPSPSKFSWYVVVVQSDARSGVHLSQLVIHVRPRQSQQILALIVGETIDEKLLQILRADFRRKCFKHPAPQLSLPLPPFESIEVRLRLLA